MHTENSIIIFAPLPEVFTLGAAIADWPRHLPHYRRVTVLSDDGRVKQAEMAAFRDRIPVQWRTSQVLVPEDNRIIFFHTGGVTRGMYVEWNLRERPSAEGGGVEVVISHELSYPLPALTNWFARDIVGGQFVSQIAGKTLATFKVIAERHSLEGRQ
jgi:ribosome-associated toxin RatA of RatAB toxin-antitoxin module